MDASGREFPVAFAITGNESKKTWGWFFDKCRSTLGEDFFNGYALMRPRHSDEKVVPTWRRALTPPYFFPFIHRFV